MIVAIVKAVGDTRGHMLADGPSDRHSSVHRIALVAAHALVELGPQSLARMLHGEARPRCLRASVRIYMVRRMGNAKELESAGNKFTQVLDRLTPRPRP